MPHSDRAKAEQTTHAGNNVPVSWLRRFVRRAIRFILITVVVVGVAIWVIYASAQKEPEFYQVALSLSEQAQAEQGDGFEKQLIELQNNARTQRQWQAVFTEVQINGWLASDFSEKFPNSLPRNVSDPRVGIEQDMLRIAFRFNSTRVKGIVQAEADAFCTEIPGQIAVRIRSVRSGLVPIPMNSIADRVSAALRRLGARVQWTEIDRDPVALIDLPPDKVKFGNKRITIEAIQLLEQQLVLTGTSIDLD
jgi:hypothetical protein